MESVTIAWQWLSANRHRNELNVTILVSLTLIATIFLLAKKLKSKPNLPPGPRGLPIVGFLPFLGTDLHITFTNLAKIYGPIYKFWLGSRLCVVLSSPEAVKQVVRDHDAIFSDRDPTVAAAIASYGTSDIAFKSYGPEWRKLRKIFVREMLSHSSLDSCYDLRQQQVKIGMNELYRKIGTPIDVGKAALATITNAVMNMVSGGELQGYGSVDELHEMVSQLMVMLGTPNVSDVFPVLARFDFQGVEKKMKIVNAWFDGLFNLLIEQRKTVEGNMEKNGKGGGRIDFLQYLLDVKDKKDDASSSLSLLELKALLMDIVVGGTDTTATMITWTMAELLLHPQIMNKVSEELRKVIGLNHVVEESHLPKLHYLDAVVKETLRLHPPIPLLVPHVSTQTCKVSGYNIPKGTKTFLNVWSIHRDPNVWDNPLEFRPERFLDDANEYDFAGNNFHFLPFGSGRRVCAGIPLAERTSMYVLATLLHSFEWKLPKDSKIDLDAMFGIVLKKSTPLIAIPTPRLSNLELYA